MEGLFSLDFAMPILTALIAFIGTFLGARYEQWLAEKRQIRDALIQEFRNTEAAITGTLAFWNKCMNFKRQIYVPFKAWYKQSSENDASSTLDLILFPVIEFPIDLLTHHFEKISVSRRPIFLFYELLGSSQVLNQTISGKNELNKEFKLLCEKNIDCSSLYYGKDHSDTRYRDHVEHIELVLDDSLHFSRELCIELVAHGKKLESEIKSLKMDSLIEPFFDPVWDEDALKLMPDPEKYKEFVLKKVS
jgi:hypothetical protein